VVLPNDTDLSFAFSTVTVPLNSSVKTGDHLALSISGPDFAPYCHLEYDTKTYSVANKEQAPGKLLMQGSGQNSWRGIDGRTTVVYERAGKSVKFFATVEK
jgi:hypothetical protein